MRREDRGGGGGESFGRVRVSRARGVWRCRRGFGRRIKRAKRDFVVQVSTSNQISRGFPKKRVASLEIMPARLPGGCRPMGIRCRPERGICLREPPPRHDASRHPPPRSRRGEDAPSPRLGVSARGRDRRRARDAPGRGRRPRAARARAPTRGGDVVLGASRRRFGTFALDAEWRGRGSGRGRRRGARALGRSARGRRAGRRAAHRRGGDRGGARGGAGRGGTPALFLDGRPPCRLRAAATEGGATGPPRAPSTRGDPARDGGDDDRFAFSPPRRAPGDRTSPRPRPRTTPRR